MQDLISKYENDNQIKSYISKSPSPGEIFSEFKLKTPVNTRAAIS